jgi:hypothetical protein
MLLDLTPSATNSTDGSYLQDQDDYFTTVDMNRKGNAPQADLTEMSHFKSSPLRLDDEKWSLSSPIDSMHLHQESNNTAASAKTQQPYPSHKINLNTDEEEADIDDDKDHDFDWNDNPDSSENPANASSMQRSTTIKRIRKVYRKCCCWNYLSNFMKRVVIAIVGSSIFITVGVCVYIYFPRPSEAELADPEFTNIRANVQAWMYWAAFMWHIAWITTFLIEAVPFLVSKWVKVFRGRRSERLKTYLEVTIVNNYLSVGRVLIFYMGSSII